MIAMLFPGQGSQAIGMGSFFYEQFSEARHVFHEVDEALNEKLSSLIFEGDIKELTKTSNAQPALMATSIAMLRVLEKELGTAITAKSQWMAGHSLGEYSAACALGVISLKDTTRLLRLRGSSMQQAVPEGVGAMAAIIGLPFAIIETLCNAHTSKNQYCGIANDNSPDQVVITGHKESVEAAMEACKNAGAKRALALPVSAPFHSPLMKPASDAVCEKLNALELFEPLGTLVSNARAEPITSMQDIKRALVDQITHRVRFREVCHTLQHGGVSTFIEIGSGKVLTNLVKRTLSDVSPLTLNQPSDLKTVLNAFG
jgi:[acyl-carrier-protein] S-malonyltransferase